MSSTRPIPIGASGSQRNSPITPNPNNSHAIVSHSLPVDMHHVHLSRFMTRTDDTRSGGLQPPRAPFVGSMPEPHFLQLESMPDLALGPPADIIPDTTPPARTPAVIPFASSCPDKLEFLQTRSSWTPTLEPYLAEHDDFDLSKSPALAAMSALRDSMSRNGVDLRNTQQADTDTAFRSLHAHNTVRLQPSRHYYASDESSGNAVSAELLERLSITSEEGQSEDQDKCYQTPRFLSQMPIDQRRRAERRESYGNMSDSGDTGIFEFDDQ